MKRIEAFRLISSLEDLFDSGGEIKNIIKVSYPDKPPQVYSIIREEKCSFTYFMDTEGGLDVCEYVEDLTFIPGWMSAQQEIEDKQLVEWMKSAIVGDVFSHRLGTMVRVCQR
ncbi:hypothetical protein DRN75_00925 [Nanoarchaeota archaeon]|nr:MAG: hypothetical protein DRN75_00925 [Nanoarchaeota archaeon]